MTVFAGQLPELSETSCVEDRDCRRRAGLRMVAEAGRGGGGGTPFTARRGWKRAKNGTRRQTRLWSGWRERTKVRRTDMGRGAARRRTDIGRRGLLG